MRAVFSLMSVLILLGGCSYAFDRSTQDVTILTPGAEHAMCYVYVDGLRHKVYPPQSTIITKSEEDLIVDCLAPGNRRKKVVIEPTITEAAKYNVANLGLGLPVDYLSKALYEYPRILEVNFTDSKPSAEPMPAQNKPDVRTPEDIPVEEFRPSRPILNADRDQPPIEIRSRYEANAIEASSGDDVFQESGDETYEGKGSLRDVINTYSGAINPSEPAEDAPIVIVPGE